MSRLTSLSPAALKAIFSPETNDNLIMAMTINIDGSYTYIADGYTQRLTGAGYTDDEQVVYGIYNNGKKYIFLPINVSLPSEEEGSAPKCSITIHDVTRYLIPTLRLLTSPPEVTLELYLASSVTPGTPGASTSAAPEVTFTGFNLTSITYNAETIQAELTMVSYQNEPFPCFSFIPRYFPGLF